MTAVASSSPAPGPGPGPMHHDSGRLGANLVPTDVEPHGHHHGGSLPGPGLPEWSADRERAWLSQEQGEEELPEPICGGCGKLIDETSADAGVIHFATQLWHVDCFRCAKCHNKVTTDRDDILLLSDGHPICGQCNYCCQICGLPIMEEAIMTGDESYHASCFTCRSCHMRIEELVFAKTSQGIYCMTCHNERVARSRRHAESKRSKTLKREAQREAQSTRSGSSSRSQGEDARSTLTGQSSADLRSPGSPPASAQTYPTRESERSLAVSSPKPPLIQRISDDGLTRPTNGSQSTRGSEDGSKTPVNGSSSQLSSATGGGSSDVGPPGVPAKDAKLNGSASQAGSAQAQLSASSSLGAWLPMGGKPVPAALQRPGSAGLGAKRPMHAPPPPLRDLRAGRSTSPIDGRPNTANSVTRNRSNSGGIHGPGSAPTSATIHTSETAPAGLGMHRPSGSVAVNDSSPDPSTSASPDRSAEPDGKPASATRAQANPGPSPAPGSTPASRQDAPAVGLGLGIDAPVGQNAAAKADTSKKANGRGSSREASRFSSGSEEDSDLEGGGLAQLKRASRLSVAATSGAEPKSESSSLPVPSIQADGAAAPAQERLSRSFSFYDPDFISLMDSFGKMESMDDIKLSSPSKGSPPTATPKQRSPVTKVTILPKETAFVTEKGSGVPFSDGDHSVTSPTGLPKVLEADEHDERDEDDEEVLEEKRSSPYSLAKISHKMRESMKNAQDGHVSMDTSFVESILRDLDETKERMKDLQTKYDRIRRASQQAAQGFSMAKEEFEQEVHARHEAELEMARLKQQIVEQASKLATMTSEKRREEHLQRRSQEVKSSLQGMERDLAKLTVERDLTVAEVAELVAMQDGRADLMKDSHSAGTSAITRNLSVRLEGVKEKYRKEIDELTFERDALLIEIEELKQSREVFLEETAALNARNDELNEVLSQVSRQIDRANQDAARMQHMQASLRDPQGKGQGAGFLPFGKQNRHPNGSPSISSSNDTHFNLSTPVNQTSDPGHEMKVVKPEKIEPAPVVKKFKWMKPKLSDSAKNAGQNIASALPMGQSPPVPPKPSAPSPTPLQASQRNLSNEIVVREHLFQPFNVLRPTRCFACQKNMWGQSEVRCALCGQACHSKCLQNLPTSCNQPFSRGDEPTEPAGPSMFGKDLVEQAQLEQRSVPLVVEKCIQAVEALGMDYEGIYRKSGGSSQLRVITQLFERGSAFNLEDTDRFNDVSAVTSVLKNYFRELPTPLLTFDLHERFIRAAEVKNDPSAKADQMAELVEQLPREHFLTLRHLILHLHRVQARSEENRMNARNLGVVFGPTLMRSGDPSQEFAHMGGKAMTIEYFIEHPELFD